MDVRWAIAAVVLVVAPFVPPSWIEAVAMIATLTIGVAHGAVDPVLAPREVDKKTFYAAYLATGAAVLILWWLAPRVALAAFVLASVAHFGEGDVRHWRAPSALTALSRGLLVVVVPCLLRSGEVPPIAAALGAPLPAWGDEGAVVAAAIMVWHVGAALHVGGPRAALDALVLVVVFARLPVVVSFSLYFTVWHASGHLRDVSSLRPRGLLRHAVTWTAVSWLGIALFAVCAARWVDAGHRWAVVFGFLSAVTAPHMAVVLLAMGRRARALAPGVNQEAPS